MEPTYGLGLTRIMSDGRRGPWLVVATALLFWFVVGCQQEVDLDALLIQQLAHQDTNERWRAALSIREMKPVPQKFVVPLIQALDDSDARVRCTAAEALGEAGLEGLPHIDKLAQLSTSHPDSQVRVALQQSVAKLTAPPQ